jgi:hypothetical protein
MARYAVRRNEIIVAAAFSPTSHSASLSSSRVRLNCFSTPNMPTSSYNQSIATPITALSQARKVGGPNVATSELLLFLTL